jgi:hypothetical protein
MNIVPKFDYKAITRVTEPNGPRYYMAPDSTDRLPSVTTILDRTSDKTGLFEWRKRVGAKEADRITRESANRGTLMHTHMECYVNNQPRPTGNNLVRQVAEAMADQIIENGLSKVTEVWGTEVGLYYPGLYAGTTDLVGLYEDRPAIMDFKTARKIKKTEWVQGYMHQTVAYALAHNALFGTDIKTGVIFMVDENFDYQQWVIEGAEWDRKVDEWLDIVDRYFAMMQVSA